MNWFEHLLLTWIHIAVGFGVWLIGTLVIIGLLLWIAELKKREGK